MIRARRRGRRGRPATSVAPLSDALSRLAAAEDPEPLVRALRSDLPAAWLDSAFWISAFEHLEDEYWVP